MILALTLATINALFEPFDLKTVMGNFVDYLENGAFTPYGEVFDVGNGTSAAIKSYEETGDTGYFRPEDELNNGNGALMRVWPVAFYEFDSDRTIEEISDELTGLTHGHRRSRLASRFFIYFLRMMPRVQNVERALDMAIRRSNRTAMETAALETEELGWLAITDEQSSSADIISRLKAMTRDEVPSSGYVVDTLQAVLWTLLHTTSFAEAVQTAAALGDDTDTIAALVAVIMTFADPDFPAEWMADLGAKEKIERELLLADESGKFA
ncbi:MAG: ADP-ribosylglycohydrolase family protein [Weissella confusa]